MNNWIIWVTVGLVLVITWLIIRHIRVKSFDKEMSEARNNFYSLNDRLDDICIKHHEQLPYEDF